MRYLIKLDGVDKDAKPLILTGEYHQFTPMTKVHDDVEYPLLESNNRKALLISGALVAQLAALLALGLVVLLVILAS